MKKKLHELWCAIMHKCPKCGEHKRVAEAVACGRR